jgi:hypothetical protein
MNRRVSLLMCLFLAACGGSANDAATEEEAGTRPVLQYEPAAVSLTGVIDTIFQYGPPGFGENPAVDEHVILSVLKLRTPIDVEGDAASQFNRDTARDIRMLQLVAPDDRMWAELNGKPVTATGTLYHSQTAGHYTEVLLNVQSIVPDSAR